MSKKKQAKGRKPRVWWVTVGAKGHERDVFFNSFGSRRDALEYIEVTGQQGFLSVIKVAEVLPKRRAR